MLTTDQITRLNSTNVSMDEVHTSAVVSTLWGKATNKQKAKAVELGGYKNTKSFIPAKNVGNISVRMTVTLAQAFGIDPFYIIGKITENEGFSEERLNNFLRDFGFDDIVRVPMTVDTLADYAGKIIKDVEMTDELKNIPDEDLINLVKALITYDKLGNLSASLKLDIIKKILVY